MFLESGKKRQKNIGMKLTGLKQIFITSLLTVIPLGFVSAQTSKPATKKHTSIQEDLIAYNKVIPRIMNVVDSAALKKRLEQEYNEYPAIDLYGDNWNTEWVNPYKATVQFPDSFSIDVSEYCMPVPGYKTSDYGPRWRRMHRGVDLKLQVGDTVRAAFSGKVRITKYEARGYGYYVLLRHTNGLETIYGHLSKILVRPNQIVKVGEPIALGGNTGRSTGPHLHFETRFLGLDINPNKIFDFVNQVPHTDTYVFRSKTPVKNVSSAQLAASKSKNNGSKYLTYRIKKGDTLSSIAVKYRTTVNSLCRLNGISKNKVLRLGQTIRVK